MLDPANSKIQLNFRLRCLLHAHLFKPHTCNLYLRLSLKMLTPSRDNPDAKCEMGPNLKKTQLTIIVHPLWVSVRVCLLPLSEMSKVTTHETRGNSS